MTSIRSTLGSLQVWWRGACVALLLALATQGATIQSAAAHAGLLETTPMDGAAFDASPEHVVLLFNEPVRLLFLRVLGGDGRNLVPPDSLIAADERVEAPLPPKLSNGVYVASYRVVSEDGHPIGGSLIFRGGLAAGTQGPVPALDTSI